MQCPVTAARTHARTHTHTHANIHNSHCPTTTPATATRSTLRASTAQAKAQWEGERRARAWREAGGGQEGRRRAWIRCRGRKARQRKSSSTSAPTTSNSLPRLRDPSTPGPSPARVSSQEEKSGLLHPGGCRHALALSTASSLPRSTCLSPLPSRCGDGTADASRRSKSGGAGAGGAG